MSHSYSDMEQVSGEEKEVNKLSTLIFQTEENFKKNRANRRGSLRFSTDQCSTSRPSLRCVNQTK
jgi:hypothetical protein